MCVCVGYMCVCVCWEYDGNIVEVVKDSEVLSWLKLGWGASGWSWCHRGDSVWPEIATRGQAMTAGGPG